MGGQRVGLCDAGRCGFLCLGRLVVLLCGRACPRLGGRAGYRGRSWFRGGLPAGQLHPQPAAAQQGKQGHQPEHRRPLFALHRAHHPGKSAHDLFLFQRKTGGQHRRGLPGSINGMEQRLAVGLPPLGRTAGRHRLVAGQLDLPLGLPGHPVDQRVEPVHRPRQQDQQLALDVPSAAVGHFMGQNQRQLLFGRQLHRQKQGGRSKPRHHGAGPQRALPHPGQAGKPRLHGGGANHRLHPVGGRLLPAPHPMPPAKVGRHLHRQHSRRAQQPYRRRHGQRAWQCPARLCRLLPGRNKSPAGGQGLGPGLLLRPLTAAHGPCCCLGHLQNESRTICHRFAFRKKSGQRQHQQCRQQQRPDPAAPAGTDPLFQPLLHKCPHQARRACPDAHRNH